MTHEYLPLIISTIVTEIPSMINATRTEAPLNNIYWELPSSGLANLLYEVTFQKSVLITPNCFHKKLKS